MKKDTSSSYMLIGFLFLIASSIGVFMPYLLTGLGISSVSGSNVLNSFMSVSLVLVKGCGVMCFFLGMFFMIFGLILPSGDLLGNDEDNVVFSYFEEKKFLWMNKGRYKTVQVDISSLSDKLRSTISEKVQVPLEKLYKTALSSKKAEAIYKSISPYLISVGEDLDSAVKGCSNELMEDALCGRLYVIENFISGLQEDIDKAVKQDEDESEALKRLEVENYRPFSLTEELDKLV